MKRFKWVIANVPEILSCTAFAIVLLDVFLNVLLRYFFEVSFSWCEEVAAIGFIWIIFIGGAACYKRKMHIGIDVLVTSLPKKAQTAIQLFVFGALFLFNLYLTYLSIRFSFGAWTKITLALGIPYTFLDIASTVGFIFITFYALRDLLHSLRSVAEAQRVE